MSPQKDQSSRIGTSSSPIVNSVIQNSKDGQKTGQTTADAFNKKPVKK